jgi:hypothetical protein
MRGRSYYTKIIDDVHQHLQKVSRKWSSLVAFSREFLRRIVEEGQGNL